MDPSVSLVRLRPTIAGLVLLIAGILGAQYGPQNYLKEVPKPFGDTFQVAMEVRELSFWSYSYRFEASTSVNGNGTISGGSYGQVPDINFFVLDGPNFEAWKQRQPAVQYLVKITQAQSRFEFSFATPKNGTYFFVFDNYYSTMKREVSLSARYQYVKIIKEQYTDYTFSYVGIGIALVGAIILTYGLLKKPEIRWA
jgi:hypothetical protein